MAVTTLLRDMRIRRRLKQVELAQQSGVSVFKLSVFESGAARPGRTNARKLADALGVNVEEIFPHLTTREET